MTMSRRLQILLDEERYERVAAIATVRQISVAAVIRDAIDRSLAEPDDRRRAAAARDILNAPPMDVPERVEDLVAELNEIRSRRA
ncbi:MAG: antitoxin [Actinomycetota bacterium]|nr:antitoxin [Actinomycetota bacterium]